MFPEYQWWSFAHNFQVSKFSILQGGAVRYCEHVTISLVLLWCKLVSIMNIFMTIIVVLLSTIPTLIGLDSYPGCAQRKTSWTSSATKVGGISSLLRLNYLFYRSDPNQCAYACFNFPSINSCLTRIFCVNAKYRILIRFLVVLR